MFQICKGKKDLLLNYCSIDILDINISEERRKDDEVKWVTLLLNSLSLFDAFSLDYLQFLLFLPFSLLINPIVP